MGLGRLRFGFGVQGFQVVEALVLGRVGISAPTSVLKTHNHER